MGARRIRRKVQKRTVPGHGGTLGLILFGVGAPMFLGFFLIALDIHPDLSDGHPREAGPNDTAIHLGWPSLRLVAPPRASMIKAESLSRSHNREDPPPKDGAIVKMLGYMMDGYKFTSRGTNVWMFVLMPEAGHFLHPAHRIPDEMVEVWPKVGTVVFKDRELVWASGKFERLTSSTGDHALYALREASVTPASQQEIAGWFAP